MFKTFVSLLSGHASYILCHMFSVYYTNEIVDIYKNIPQ